jgi:glycosyl hydrolase family 35
MTTSPRSRCTGFVYALVLFVVGAVGVGTARSTPRASGGAASPSQTETSDHASRGVEIVTHGGYPELRVNGEPFFIHSAAFFYYRVPRDLWEVSLERYRGLGINTIDIYIPWNWHELADGEFDFDGHTNPRRDLRGLLKMLSNKNLKLIARPGPLILNEWRFGGYPEWLLQRADFQAAMPAEFRMDGIDVLEGRYPPLAGLNSRDAEAAATAWLANPLHMDYSRKWLEAVGRELAPYAAGAATAGGAVAKDQGPPVANPPLLFAQLDDDVAGGHTNRAGPAVWRYLESLRAALRGGGLGVPVFINPTDARVAAAGSGLADPIGVMGQWYLRPNGNIAAGKGLELTAEDASTIELFAEELKTQPGFPPALIEYQAGWYAPGDDDRPIESAAENTLDSSRLFLAHGLHGISYFPLQDSVTPAGWSVPWANQNYLWNAALDPNGRLRRRADAIARNADILMRWGPQLAASHKRADFGVIYPLGAYDQGSLTADDIRRVSEGVQKIERLAQLGHFSSELLDPEYQPVEQLLRDPLIFLPVFDRAPDASAGGDASALQLSEKAQRALVEYVRQGGTLFVFPRRPAGAVISELWKDAAAANAEPADVVSVRREFGAGHVIESSKDLFSWLNLKQNFFENRQAEPSDWNLRALRKIFSQAGVRPAIVVLGDPPQASSLVITELISNEGTEKLGARTGGHGWLSVTNLNADDAIDASLSVLTPAASSLQETPERVSLDITVPARESLLLPLGFSLCLDEKPPPDCTDEVSISGAELVSAAREGKTLELTFYTPARAPIRLRLEQAPSHVEVEDTTPETKWSQERHELSLATSRGTAPGYLRKLKVQLPYVPHVPAVKREANRGRGWSEMSVVNALRLPLGPITNLGTSPPLIVIDDPRAARVVLEASNTDRDFHGDIDVNLTGPYKGSASLRILAGQIAVDSAKLKAAAPDDPGRGAGGSSLDENGLLHGSIEAREGHDRKYSAVFYVPLRADATTAYRYDFDDGGALEWVLENAGVRLIVSPANGGRALALVDKATGFDVLSSVGGLRDGFSFTPNPPGIAPERARGRYGFFNRVYEAAWVPDDKNTAMTLRYHAADAFPYGASIAKRVEVAGDVVSVSYRVSLDSAAAASSADAGATLAPVDQQQSFVATQSVPTLDERGRLTKFCWWFAAPKDASAARAKDSAADATHCEDFAPGGAAIEIPSDANHLEVRTPGRPGLAIDWDAGRLTIEPKRYSALVELRSAALKPGEETRAALHFRVLAPE